ncbi:MAG: hypothetical protein IIC60_04210 [Proteobacteria bacterium]|nr:hypothetical protein [Pseudomonadota bacterium]
MSHRSALFTRSFLLALLVIVSLLGWGIFRRSQLDSSSQQLAIATTEAVFTSETAQQLVDHAHRDLLEQMSAETLITYLSSVQRSMGPVESIAAIVGGTDVTLFPFSRRPPTASYEIDLIFSGNTAKVILKMVYQQGKWQFTAYSIQADLLLL